VRVFFELEPSFNGAGADAGYVVHGFVLDAGDAVQQTHRAHRLEIVGDSISAGYGASGVGGDCPVMDHTSGNYGTYNRQICDAFDAECSVIAWSGKGMYENCCDSGETMPSYYLQTRGGSAYAADWDFTRFVPDAIIINLGELARRFLASRAARQCRLTVALLRTGTNDFGHDSGPSWEAAFSATYVSFVLNATQVHYKQPKMPVFVAQGPMNNGAPLHDALQVAIAAINQAGGKLVPRGALRRGAAQRRHKSAPPFPYLPVRAPASPPPLAQRDLPRPARPAQRRLRRPPRRGWPRGHGGARHSRHRGRHELGVSIRMRVRARACSQGAT
jgi:hypothetical protein